jgi:hypothetical protein
MKLVKRTLFLFLVSGVINGLNACSDTKKTEETTPAHQCATSITSTTGGQVACISDAAADTTISLQGGSGEQYVVTPYVLGDSSTVKGASSTTFDFTVKATSANLSELSQNLAFNDLNSARMQNEVGQLSAQASQLREIENLNRLIANRFDPARGNYQETWLWETVRSLDRLERRKFARELNLRRRIELSVTENRMRQTDEAEQQFDDNVSRPLLANCPSTVVAASGSGTTSLTTTYDGTSFCVGYAATPSADIATNIQTAIATIVSTYKDTIYKDQMTTNVKGGYSFNPLIVFVSTLEYDGAFNRSATSTTLRPVLYLKSSLTKAKLYATLAHEMQHAIVDYYKARGTSTIDETVAVDEGLAHLMEDAFGYGEDCFTSYASVFLSAFVDGSPFFMNDTDANKAVARGGSHAFLYFLAERYGGFKVENNKPFSGSAWAPIVSLVKQTDSNGPQAVATAFGQTNLVERAGEFFGAIMADNRGYSFSPTEFTISNYSGITDLLSATGLTFGMRFSNFKIFKGSGTTALSDVTSGLKLRYYETSPVLIKTTAANPTVTIGFPTAITNRGVAVTRIK